MSDILHMCEGSPDCYDLNKHLNGFTHSEKLEYFIQNGAKCRIRADGLYCTIEYTNKQWNIANGEIVQRKAEFIITDRVKSLFSLTPIRP